MKSPIDYKFWNFAFLSISLVLFLPVFLNVFSAHTDGLFVLTRKGDWLGDKEAGILFMQGRPLWALIDSFLGWFIFRAEDLTWLRVAVFALTLVSSRLIFLILKRQNIELSICYGVSFMFILLPGIILNLIWVDAGIPEALSILCGVASYFLFGRWFLSGLCFLTGLLIYQPTAVIVFALMAVKLLWKNGPLWREICFYVLLMVIYWALVKLIVLPWGHHWGLVPTALATYKMDVGGHIIGKLFLGLDTLKYGFAGIWDPFLHQHAFLELGFVALSLCFLGAGSVPQFFRKLFFFCILFFCANTPSFMAINCKAVMGYRTLIPMELMGLLAIVYGLRHSRPWLMAYTFSALIAASWIINQDIADNVNVYTYTQALAKRMDDAGIRQVYLRYSAPVWSSFSLPLDMGYFPIDLDYIFKDADILDTFADWPLFFDKHTLVIDYGFLSTKRLIDDKKVYIDAVGGKQDVRLVRGSDRLERYPVLFFKGGPRLSDWAVGAPFRDAFIYLNFIGPKESLDAFGIDADCKTAQGSASFFDFKWQTLNRHHQWVDISAPTAALGETKITRLVGSPALKYFRLVFTKRMTADRLVIKDLRFISH